MTDHEPGHWQYDEDEGKRPVRLGYEGSEVAMVMRVAFLLFVVWSVWYVLSNGVPSLREWLENPPIDLF